MDELTGHQMLVARCKATEAALREAIEISHCNTGTYTATDAELDAWTEAAIQAELKKQST